MCPCGRKLCHREGKVRGRRGEDRVAEEFVDGRESSRGDRARRFGRPDDLEERMQESDSVELSGI